MNPILLQVFSENMGKKSEPQVTFSLKGENWTKVTFKPDIAKFNMTHLDDDAIALMDCLKKELLCHVTQWIGDK